MTDKLGVVNMLAEPNIYIYYFLLSMKKTTTVLLSLILFVTSGCMQPAQETSEKKSMEDKDKKIMVTATIGMIADVVENVGGEEVEVVSLMGPGVDPHLYKASSGDISRLENADIIFYNGLHLEGKMGEIFESMSKQKPTVAVAEVISESDLLGVDPEEGGGSHDPHIWFDIELWVQAIDKIEDTLSAYAPEKKALFEKNAQEYNAKLTELNTWAKAEMNKIDENGRVLITSHDAFGYFGRAYGMEVMGIQGISTASDYGLKDLERVIDLIVDRKIKAIFIESSVPKKSIEAVQEGVKAKGYEVVIGGELLGDAMGDAGTEEGTYLGMIKYNVETIVNALQ